jgi:hypothetical protein
MASKKTMCLTKMPMHVGMREAANLDSLFFCFLEEINNLSSTFFLRKNKHIDNKLPMCHLYNEKQKLIPL